MIRSVFKNRYYKGTRPGLGVRSRDDHYMSRPVMDRNGNSAIRENDWFVSSRRSGLDDNLYRESEKSRHAVDLYWSEDSRGGQAFSDHDDYRSDWGTGR